MSFHRFAGPILLAAGVFCAPVAGQSVTGTVLDGATGEPLPGVLVSLLAEDGDRVRAVLSDEDGRFGMEVAQFGRYRLQSERIGLGTTTSELFTLFSTNPVERRLEMGARPIAIAGLVVDSRVKQCRLDAERGVQIQRWWREVRTALGVSSVLQTQGLAQFSVERFERQWDADLERIVSNSVRQEMSVSDRPFVSAEAGFLSEGGFVQGALTGQREYYAPDADVLLSNEFLSDHCFSITEHEDDRLVGLAFEPNRIGGVPDIRGTLWVDSTTAELQSLDFRYAGMTELPENESGGFVGFQYLESGAWIVRDWYIRMPHLGMRSGPDAGELELLGYVDVGGRVTLLEKTAVDRARLGEVGAIRGMIYDSIRGRGLADATVSIIGTQYRALTDANGEFVLASVPVGAHQVTFAHADPLAWGLGSSFITVEVEPDRSSGIYMALPGFRQTARVVCMGSGADAETVLLGQIVDRNGTGLGNTAVTLTWRETRQGGRAFDMSHELRTGSDGRFVACTVPADASISVSVHLERFEIDGQEFTGSVDGFEVTAPAGDIVYRRMMLPGVG